MHDFFKSSLSLTLFASSLQESAGGKSQLSSVVSASMMLMIILWIGPVFETLPRSVLSCIVVVNLRSMFLQFKQLPVSRTCFDFSKSFFRCFGKHQEKILSFGFQLFSASFYSEWIWASSLEFSFSSCLLFVIRQNLLRFILIPSKSLSSTFV